MARSNWYQKFEEEKDKIREFELNNSLTKISKLMEETSNRDEIIKLLEKAISVYEDLIRESIEYDKNDFERCKKRLADLRYRKLQDIHIQSDTSESWNQYQEEEQDKDKKEEEYDRMSGEEER